MKNVVGLSFGGKVSPESLLANAHREAADFRTVIVISIGKDEMIRVGTTAGSRCELLGMLRVAEDSILEEMAAS